MSKGSQILLGIVFAFAAGFFAYVASTDGPRMPAGEWPFYGLSVFSAAVACACLVSRSRPITLRVIGAGIFAAFLFTAVNGYFKEAPVKAVGGLVVFGLPCAFLTITGKYPTWGRVSAVFNGTKNGETPPNVG